MNTLAEKNQKRAFEIIKELCLFEIFEQFNIKANLVGSLQSGLLMKNKDIDFHIYSNPFVLEDSFSVMQALAQNGRIKEIMYKNLLDTDEMCLEWHAWYEDVTGELWQIDIIHILNESPFAGKIERTTERIKSVLTPELKEAILSIKNDIPDGMKVRGIEIYRAVISDGVKNYTEFQKWRNDSEPGNFIDWEP